MSDTQAACMNFLNALEKIQEVIKSHQECADKLRVDLPTLQAIAARTWGKEDELKALKGELATLNKKITAELAPKQDNPRLLKMLGFMIHGIMGSNPIFA